MNNNFFSLARYLRGWGMEAELFVMPDANEHFHPQCDTFDDVSQMEWVKQFPVGEDWRDFFVAKHSMFASLMEYDLIVACGYAMAILRKFRIQPDVFIPYGSDLIDFPFWYKARPTSAKGLAVMPFRWWMRIMQRQAVFNARLIMTNTAIKIYADAFKKINKRCLNVTFPMVYNNYDFKANTKWDRLIEHDFVVFNHSRQVWQSNPDNLPNFAQYGGGKRNDKVIRAFSRFLRSTSFQSPLLVLFEYGIDVDHSKKLIADLGIGQNVLWAPLSQRKDIMAGLRFASIGIDQLRKDFCGIGGTSHEIMASGVPLITHTDGAIYDPNHQFYKAPIIDALDEDELFEIFVDYEGSPEKYKQIGAAGKEWFDRNLGVGLAKIYYDIFTLLGKNTELNQDSVEICDLLKRVSVASQ